jgi:hypothetical protein
LVFGFVSNVRPVLQLELFYVACAWRKNDMINTIVG